MKSPRWFVFLLLPVALFCLLFLAAVFFLVLAVAPPAVSAVALVLLALVAAWLIFGRQKSDDSAGAFSESAFATKSTREGLL